MRINRMTGMCAFALGLTASITINALGQQTESVRTIPVPKEDHGYSNFDSTIIRSQDELDAFLKRTSHIQGMGWNNRKDFEEAIRRARLDFSKEILVLLRHTKGSSSVQIHFRNPLIKGKRVVCEVKRSALGGGAAVMTYYCFALAVDKANFTEVELRVAGQKPILLSLKKEKSNKPDVGGV